jgi:hypothetical protein
MEVVFFSSLVRGILLDTLEWLEFDGWGWRDVVGGLEGFVGFFGVVVFKSLEGERGFFVSGLRFFVAHFDYWLL